MRVLFTVSNWPGHWHAMVPLGWALQAAGHQVRVACTPCQAGPVTHAGLMPVPLLEAMDMTVRGRLHNYRKATVGTWPFATLPPHPLTGEPLAFLDEFDMETWSAQNRDWALGIVDRSADAAVDFARQWRPDLVVHDLMSLEGPLVGGALKIPALLYLWGPCGPQDPVPGAPPGASFVPMDPAGVFERHGAGPMDADVYTHVIDPSPASVRPPLTAERIPVRHVPYNGPGAHPRRGSRRARTAGPGCASSGAPPSAGCTGPRRSPCAHRRGARADRREVLLALTGDDRARVESGPPLPPHVRLLERTPLSLLLPECDLVIHHGGAGCTMTGLAAGIPQLAIHAGSDQEVIADRVAAAHAAHSLVNADTDAAAVHEAVTRLLGDPAHLAAARRLRQEMESLPAPADLVPVLSALTR